MQSPSARRKRKTTFAKGDMKVTKADGTTTIVPGASAWTNAEQAIRDDERRQWTGRGKEP